MKNSFLKAIIIIALTFAIATVWANNPTINTSYIDMIEIAANDSTNTPPNPIGDDNIPIIIKVIPPTNDNNHRTLIPITAIYNNGTIEIDFYGNIGTLYTVVTNNSTSSRWSEYIDSANGYAYMDITSYNPTGHYTIIFYSDTHGTFGGDFYVE